jgi:hypothetical protein
MISRKKLRIADRVDWWPLLVVVRVDDLERWREASGCTGDEFHRWVSVQINKAIGAGGP